MICLSLDILNNHENKIIKQNKIPREKYQMREDMNHSKGGIS